jgi:hypothetical protein
MKKIFTLLSLVLVTAAVAQSSFSLYKTNNTGTVNTNTLTHGYSLMETTTPSLTLQDKIKLVNNSATTHSYTVQRSYLFQNPLFDQSQVKKPFTLFCFGYTCFPATVSSPGPSDYTILNAGDNSNSNGTPFILYLYEDSLAIGKYAVKYLVYDVNNPSDSSSFIMRYNDNLTLPNLQGVNNLASTFESVSEIAPNPSNNNASISVVLKQESDLKIQVYNSLGALVYNGPNQKFAQGKHKIPVDCSTYSSGLYFVTLNTSETKVTKRLVVNK